jgi:hypothetical protein
MIFILTVHSVSLVLYLGINVVNIFILGCQYGSFTKPFMVVVVIHNIGEYIFYDFLDRRHYMAKIRRE